MRPLLMPICAANFVSDKASGSLRYASRSMKGGLDHLNGPCKPHSLATRNDLQRRWCYSAPMSPQNDWYLKEWLACLGKKQSDIVRDLDWNKARVSLMIRGAQQYTRDAVNELADYLNLRPYELLMHPDDANAMRRFKADAIRLAHIAESEEQAEALKKVSLG